MAKLWLAKRPPLLLIVHAAPNSPTCHKGDFVLGSIFNVFDICIISIIHQQETLMPLLCPNPCTEHTCFFCRCSHNLDGTFERASLLPKKLAPLLLQDCKLDEQDVISFCILESLGDSTLLLSPYPSGYRVSPQAGFPSEPDAHNRAQWPQTHELLLQECESDLCRHEVVFYILLILFRIPGQPIFTKLLNRC